MKLRHLALPAAGALTAALTLTAPAAATTAGLTWSACPGADAAVQCATLKVPLDWSHPDDGRTIDLALARRKATKPAVRIGSVILDPGGPGVGGVEEVKRKKDVFTTAVSERFDVVGFDPRGVGASTPVLCDTEVLERATAAKSLATRGAADFAAFARANAALSRDCRERTGALYDHLDSRQVVRDVNAIRAALGEAKITQVGYSYGTLTGQLYAEMFSQHVRAIVTDGNMDHSIRSLWAFLDDQTAAIERNFVQWAAWCDQTADCALYGKNAAKVYVGLRERAKNGTLTDPATGRELDFTAFTGIGQRVNLPEFWKELADKLAALSGHATPAPAPTGATPGPAPSRPAVQNYARQAMFCQDWTFRLKNYAELKRGLDRLTRRYPNVNWNPNATESALDCVGYSGKATNPQTPLKIGRGTPIVMAGNRNDFATVHAWSRHAAARSGAPLVTYEGFGHTVYPSTVAYGPSTCVNAAIDAFLIRLEPPASGLSCPDISVPGKVTQPPAPPQ
ncbi:alpha/beta hydrolase [Nonomuraea monospora]|uniref:Alpha/beta hydrolase n=1 Tax=Nonomuraea monospora TaxID=568818 RepID=A0ABN3CS78_9ACTN